MIMKTNKLYFENIDSIHCYKLEYHLHDAQFEGLEEITLVEALPDDMKEFIWCTYYGDVVERNECKKSECPHYESKSGRGVCSNRGKLYRHGEEVTFKVDRDE